MIIHISEERFLELLKAEDLLNSLEATGVDNWSGWGEHTEVWNEVLQYSDSITEEILPSDIEVIRE